MVINLMDHNYFRFSWFDTSFKNIEEYLSSSKLFLDKGYRIKYSQSINNICYEYNPNIFKAYFTKIDKGIIMIPNLIDGWKTLFHNITFNLKISGYYFSISSKNENEPYNCIIYVENGLEKRICSIIKENKKWIFYERGEPLFFENINYYQNKLKRDKLNKEIIINYLHELKIVNDNKLEIQNNSNILFEYDNYQK
jgi:hypothetical protein